MLAIVFVNIERTLDFYLLMVYDDCQVVSVSH